MYHPALRDERSCPSSRSTTVCEHIKHIFEDGELDPAATVRQFRTVQSDGDCEVSRDVEFYSLDMVIALGCRVRSHAVVRVWQSTFEPLKKYIVKGPCSTMSGSSGWIKLE